MDLRITVFGCWVIFANEALAGYPVTVIVFLRAQVEMCGVTAGWIVAGVQDVFTMSWPNESVIGKAVSALTPGFADDAISVFVFR